MLELADRLLRLVGDGVPVALATSIDVIGSAPHLLGSSMAVTADGEVIGAVSGGCVESAALEDCRAVLGGGPAVVRRYGFGDAAAARAGIACGGELDVLVHPLEPVVSRSALHAAVTGDRAALGFVLSGPDLGGAVPLDPAAGAVVQLRGRPGVVELERAEGPVRVFADQAVPAPRMVVVGATALAAALVGAAAAVGFLVTVCDPRPAFALADRFPGARRVEVAAGHVVLASADLGPRDAVCVLGHDEDLDPLALAAALESGAGYVGALGSRSTAGRRRERLAALGVSATDAARLRAPIGLDLGGSTPAETAVAILAEVLAARTGASAGVLRDAIGPIHRAAGPLGAPAV